MDPADEIVAQLTKKYNEDSKQKKAVETVKKVLENILKHPHEEKYRFFSKQLYLNIFIKNKKYNTTMHFLFDFA